MPIQNTLAKIVQKVVEAAVPDKRALQLAVVVFEWAGKIIKSES